MAPELEQIVNTTVGDGYTDAATISDPTRAEPWVAVDLNITGAAVLYSLQSNGGVWDSQEKFLGPTVGPKALGPFWGIRFRNALAAAPAQLSAEPLDQALINAAGGLGALTSPAYLVAPDGGVTPVTSGDVTPAGTIHAYAGAIAPTGYVLCDGTQYDGTNSTYAALWAVVGNQYGGVGQAAFAVPDLRGRTVVGLGPNAAVNTLGDSDGVAAASRRPQHQHTHHHHTGGAASPIVVNNVPGGAADFTAGTHPTVAESAVDGGSGVATDPLDAPAYLVLNYVIKL